MPEPRTARDLLLACAIGLVAFGVSCLVEAPGTTGFSFGLTYQQMSVDPFAMQGLFPHRILLPALAHLLSLDGDRFFLAAHGTAALLLMLVAFAARRLGAGPLDTLLLTSAAALGGATQLYKSHVGYPDSLSFLLLLAAVLAVRSGAGAWLLLLLGALAHEQVLFFAPCLLWLRKSLAGADWRRELLVAGMAVAAYAVFRAFVHGGAADDLEPGYYVGNGYFPLGFLGVLYLAAVQLALVFGPQLIALPYAHRHGLVSPRAAPDGAPHWQRPALWLFLLGILGIYAVAHDFQRFINFLFLPLLIAQRELLRRPGGRWVLAGAVLLQTLATKFLLMPVSLEFLAPMQACHCLTGVPRDLQKLVTDVLPVVWPYVVGALAALAAVLAAGAALARRSRT